MKIWIDGYEANQVQRVGSGQYGFEILRNLEKIDTKNEYTILLPHPPVEDLPKIRKNWQYKVLKPSKLWTRIALPLTLYLTRNKPDVFFSPTHYIPRFSPVKRVCTIFDLAFLHFPDMFKRSDLWQLKNWTKFSVENANHIMTISNFSKQDIISQYEVNKNKITVTYPGYDSEVFKKQNNKVDSYIIYIGTIQPRKNLIRLMEAVSKIEGLKLIIVGKTGWEYEEILLAPKKLGIENRVEFTGYLSTKEIVKLLHGALAFVLPSLYEGFGIPVVEAMASGCPVVVSNVSSLPEVVGGAGVLVDPYDVDSIASGVKKAIQNREQFIKKGLDQAKKFSWQNCAQQTLEVLESRI